MVFITPLSSVFRKRAELIISAPVFPYKGIKGKLAKTIIKLLPEHCCYVEVFAGAANVFLKKEPSKVEVINDINKELITLYRVVQNHLEEFIRSFKWALVSRAFTAFKSNY